MANQIKYRLSGSLNIIGDKSISHRSLIISAMAIGKSEISNLLESEDIFSTIKVLRALKIKIKKHDAKWIVIGNGTNGFIQPKEVLDCGNSGTTSRLMLGATSSNPIYLTFTGDKSLCGRPMSRVTSYLAKMGATVTLTNKDFFPLTMHGTDELLPLQHIINKPSAQVKSALILSALNIAGKTTITEKRKTRDHTELLLKYLNVKFKKEILKNSSIKYILNGPYEINSKNIKVAGDPSSAAFFVVGALITPNSKINIKNVCLNETRIEYLKILKKMGGKIKIKKSQNHSGEITGSIQVEYSKLKGIVIPEKLSPYLIDEYPILAVAAASAKGITKMKGLSELRFKESDRIKSIASNLKKMKVSCDVIKDDIIIKGSSKNPSGDVKIKTYGDHRIAMSFKVFELMCDKKLKFDDEECINISYPTFKSDLISLKKKK